ncbi:hypothetical protein [Hoyosella subflava]|uniref:Secreted protein n=1 Tax=Hoyosella subflava (strain DSM 45089 / JCM 17490 / NBRC 109087 / DQS3-9A1) TaxID=443218 RepID=F6ELJ0_HOYSD|nr:hypothetical protein [Hoyosella subflava]AEF40240.1 hypothetical protein AS9A_1791 [Hoyosella subflava DQS3-9A1]
MKNFGRIGSAVALSLLLGISVNTGIASAGSTTYVYSGNYEFRDRDLTTTIHFTPGHPKENVLLWANNPSGYLLYSVTMYEGNKVVWSATNQTNRVYSAGSNVSRIVMKRNCDCGGRNGVQARAR